ncbi:MAG: hypothetical protein PVF68_05220 [Acidobacteriota bacterium]
MRQTPRWIILLPALLAGSALLCHPAAAPTSFKRTTSQWFESVEPGGRLLVDNPFGNVYARFGGYENRIELLATFQRLDQDLPELVVHRDQAAAGLDVRVTGGAGESEAGPGPARRDRVDLVVYVPSGISLQVRTVKGDIEAKGLEGAFKAVSVAGNVTVRKIHGPIGIETRRGTITATLLTGATADPQVLETETGEIQVHVWEDADLKVDIATSGEISTDFSLEIEHLRFQEPGKRALAIIGAGAAELRLASKQGPIRLFRLQKDFYPDEGS